jgi:hypothetical protein
MQKIQAILQRMAEGVTALDLSRCQLSEADVQAISRALKDNRTLTALDLSDNAISDASAKDIAMALKNNHTLKSLNLSGNQISDTGATNIAIALKDNHTLRWLPLAYNKISDAGATNIAIALKDNQTLSRLSLYGNQISDAGAKYFVMTLKDNRTLTALDFGFSPISKAVQADINSFNSRNNTYQQKHIEALKYRDRARFLLTCCDFDRIGLSGFNEALDDADKIIEYLQDRGYNQARALSREVDALRAMAHLRTGNISAALDLYINNLQPQPHEAVSLAIANLIITTKLLLSENDTRTLILMCLRGTTGALPLQYNALQQLRGEKGITASQPLATLLGVDKIVSVLDVSQPPDNNHEFETCIFYEDLVLSPMNPPVHKILKGEIPRNDELSQQFESKKTDLLERLKLAYPEVPSGDLPASSSPRM